MTTKERNDIEVMEWFIPEQVKHWAVTDHDRLAMVNLSSRGIQPKYRTKGLLALMAGKTFREVHVEMYRDDIKAGYISKEDLLSSTPLAVRAWLIKALR